MEMQFVAWIASALVFMSCFMKTMVPLRMLGICSNVVFIFYCLLGLRYDMFDKLLPILILHVGLLVLNTLRLSQVKATIRKIREATSGQSSLEFLTPYMRHETAAPGQVLFNKGDAADRIYLLRRGRVRLAEIDKMLAPGDMFGEVGVFADHKSRGSTAVCTEECELFSITGDKVIELFFQDPRFGLFVVRTISQYVADEAKPPAASLNTTAQRETVATAAG
ncbi:MAG: cyclic nucleotide-binding domain-containing protein [Sulfuritalea sp.]|nr:cyclic nucleotide-binding domain-containing protein [Sulfuritalea sp.]